MTITVQPRAMHLPADEDDDVLLSARGVSKKFCRDLKRSLFYGLHDIAAEITGRRQASDTLRQKEFWALKEVNFQLRRGEALGLVGKNGSGKSTLLRIISGLIKPDAGYIEVTGRVAPLIALGAGFNPILTGRENIYANMSILGLAKQDIRACFDEVVDFAEIGEAIDAPVQSYSSGMAARLGFACAIYTQPDILLIDEVLAVGDVKFRAKCYRRLAKLREQGTAFVLVSHNPNSVLSLCKTAVYLSKGHVILAGDTSDVMRKYENDLFSEGMAKASGHMVLPSKSESSSLGLDVLSLSFKQPSDGQCLDSLVSGEAAYLCVECHARDEMDNINVNLSIQEKFGEGDQILSLSTRHDGVSLQVQPGRNELQLQLPYVGLPPGSYLMNIHVRQGPYYILDSVEGFEFSVESSGAMSQCKFYQPRHWAAVSDAS